jgi:hypothetical protein
LNDEFGSRLYCNDQSIVKLLGWGAGRGSVRRLGAMPPYPRTPLRQYPGDRGGSVSSGGGLSKDEVFEKSLFLNLTSTYYAASGATDGEAELWVGYLHRIGLLDSVQRRLKRKTGAGQ